MEKIASVEFIFANKDRVTISSGWVPRLLITGMQKNIMQISGAGVTVSYSCKSLDIIIEGDAQGTAVNEYGHALPCSAAERLLSGELTRMILTTVDGKQYKLILPNYRRLFAQRIRRVRRGCIRIRACVSLL